MPNSRMIRMPVSKASRFFASRSGAPAAGTGRSETERSTHFPVGGERLGRNLLPQRKGYGLGPWGPGEIAIGGPGSPQPSPGTPPYMRVRIRRFEE
jgi:hypothetical protein